MALWPILKLPKGVLCYILYHGVTELLGHTFFSHSYRSQI